MGLTRPELDYAYLAEYATVSPTGTLTAVGASFTQIEASTFPMQQLLSIAGRVRVPANWPGPLILNVVIEGPVRPEDQTWRPPRLELTNQLAVGGPVYEDKVGLLFSISTIVPLLGAGLYEISIVYPAHDEPWRVLKFEVTTPRTS